MTTNDAAERMHADLHAKAQWHERGCEHGPGFFVLIDDAEAVADAALAAERLLDWAPKDPVERLAYLRALANERLDERRATVERIRGALIDEPTRTDGERTVGYIVAILDAEAER